MKIIIKPIIIFIVMLVLNAFIKIVELFMTIVIDILSLFWNFKFLHKTNEYIMTDNPSILTLEHFMNKSSVKKAFIFKTYYHKIFMLGKGVQIFYDGGDDIKQLMVIKRGSEEHICYTKDEKYFLYNNKSVFEILPTDQIFSVKDCI